MIDRLPSLFKGFERTGDLGKDAPPELQAELERSLDHAVRFFLTRSWEQRYPVIHPWLRGAYLTLV